jgi:hypothetical protein
MKTIELLTRLKDCLLLHPNDHIGEILSVSQCATVSKCINSVISFGLIPCLIPSVWKSFNYKNKRIIEFTEEISPNTVMNKIVYYHLSIKGNIFNIEVKYGILSMSIFILI